MGGGGGEIEVVCFFFSRVYIRTSTGSSQKHNTFGPVYQTFVLIVFAP